MVLLRKVLNISRFHARNSSFGGKKASCHCDKYINKSGREPAAKEECQSLYCTDSQPKVIIIGAGIAGLSAAAHLIEHGCENVVVYEATDKIGGRIQSSWMGNTCIDLGPNTIYGGSIANSFFNLVNREDLVRTPVQRYQRDKAHFITTDNRIFTDTAIPTIMFNRILDQAIEAQRTGKCYTSISLRDFLCLRIQQELLRYPKPLRFDAERMLFGLLNNLRSRTGAELDNLSATQFLVNKKIPGGDVIVDRGFSTVLAGLVGKISKGNLKLKQRVERVHWCAGRIPRVSVSCASDHIEHGNFLIVALPLGVLKRKANEMFIPELPESKQRAIDLLGVGHVNRVYLDYQNPWWAPEELSMRIAWSPEELRQWNSWTKGIASLENTYNSNHVMMFTVGGKDALEMEKYSEIEIAIETTRFLRKIMNTNSIPYPNTICVSRWSTCQDCLGGSVYMPVGVSDTIINDFQTSDSSLFPPRYISPLLFAGEATHDSYFGTLHGARNSGIREANKILRIVKENKNINMCSELSAHDKCASNCC